MHNYDGEKAMCVNSTPRGKRIIGDLYQSTSPEGCNGVILSLGKAKEVQSKETHEVPIRRKPTANELFPPGLTCPKKIRGRPHFYKFKNLRSETRSVDLQRRLSLGSIGVYCAHNFNPYDR